jgi:hypothetical protein
LRSNAETGLRLGGGGHHLEEVPLRHQGDVLMAAGKTGQVEIHRLVLYLHADGVDKTVRNLREPRPQPELVK